MAQVCTKKKLSCLNIKMDTLPGKFRSPPPKPPRRRHSDQLSISSSGTFPSSKKKITNENHCYNDSKHCNENSTSSCGSLPANWTPEFCLENKIENLPVFAEKECTSIKNASHNKIDFKELILERSKSNFMCNINSQYKNTSKQTVIRKCGSPYFYLVSNEELIPFDENTLKKQFHKFLRKDSHRRHNSDPLPLNLDINNFHPFSPTISDNSKYDLCETKESKCLLQEIKSLKEINSKLWENLCCVQASIENLKNCSSDNSYVLPISDLLMSIYDSLKAKDSAMEDRMKIILQERDIAISDLDKMVHVVAQSFDDKYSSPEDKPSDEKIKELLKEVEVTNNPGKLLQQQRQLLSYLYSSKELKLDHMLHEMKLITAERDSLKLKVQYLETELKHLKLSNEIWDTDNKLWEGSLLNTLCQVIQQRDVASKSYNAHNMDFFNCRAAHQKSVDSGEKNDYLQKLEGASAKKKFFSFSLNEMKKYSPLAKSRSDEIRCSKEDISILHSTLEAEIEKRKCTEEKCVRLERLVNVLQKKLSGQNVAIPV